jgi:hypothetical protein
VSKLSGCLKERFGLNEVESIPKRKTKEEEIFGVLLWIRARRRKLGQRLRNANALKTISHLLDRNHFVTHFNINCSVVVGQNIEDTIQEIDIQSAPFEFFVIEKQQ